MIRANESLKRTNAAKKRQEEEERLKFEEMKPYIDSLVTYAVAAAADKGLTVASICDRRLNNIHYGLMIDYIKSFGYDIHASANMRYIADDVSTCWYISW